MKPCTGFIQLLGNGKHFSSSTWHHQFEAKAKRCCNLSKTMNQRLTLSCSRHTLYAFMNENRTMPGSRGSSSRQLSTRDRRSSYASKCHAVDESSPHCGKLTVDSFYILLGVYYSSQPVTSVVSWLRYPLNKIDTSSNGIYVVRNPRAGYVTTLLRSVVTTTALRFLSRVDPLDSVSNYYMMYKYTCTCTHTKKMLMFGGNSLRSSMKAVMSFLRVNLLHQLLVQLLQVPIPLLLPSFMLTVALLHKHLGQTMEVE